MLSARNGVWSMRDGMGGGERLAALLDEPGVERAHLIAGGRCGRVQREARGGPCGLEAAVSKQQFVRV